MGLGVTQDTSSLQFTKAVSVIRAGSQGTSVSITRRFHVIFTILAAYTLTKPIEVLKYFLLNPTYAVSFKFLQTLSQLLLVTYYSALITLQPIKGFILAITQTPVLFITRQLTFFRSLLATASSVGSIVNTLLNNVLSVIYTPTVNLLSQSSRIIALSILETPAAVINVLRVFARLFFIVAPTNIVKMISVDKIFPLIINSTQITLNAFKTILQSLTLSAAATLTISRIQSFFKSFVVSSAANLSLIRTSLIPLLLVVSNTVVSMTGLRVFLRPIIVVCNSLNTITKHTLTSLLAISTPVVIYLRSLGKYILLTSGSTSSILKAAARSLFILNSPILMIIGLRNFYRTLISTPDYLLHFSKGVSSILSVVGSSLVAFSGPGGIGTKLIQKVILVSTSPVSSLKTLFNIFLTVVSSVMVSSVRLLSMNHLLGVAQSSGVGIFKGFAHNLSAVSNSVVNILREWGFFI